MKYDLIAEAYLDMKIRGQITENLKNSFFGYIGPEEKTPEKRGFVQSLNDQYLYTHKDHPGKFFLFRGASTPIKFDSKSDALAEYGEILNTHSESLGNLMQTVNNHYKEDNYTPEQKLAIHNYTVNSSVVNNSLINNSELSNEHKELMKNLDNAIQKKKTPKSMIVYSVTNKDHSNLLRNNDIVEHPSYLSTTINPEVAHEFYDDWTTRDSSTHGDLLQINIPKGFHGVYAGEMSSAPWLHEFILPRNTKLRIDHSKRKVIVDGNNTRYVHQAYPVIDKKENTAISDDSPKKYKNFDITIKKSSEYYQTLRDFDRNSSDVFHNNLANEFKLASKKVINFPQKENHIGAKVISQTPQSITIRNMFNHPITEQQHQEFIDAYSNYQNSISTPSMFKHTAVKE